MVDYYQAMQDRKDKAKRIFWIYFGCSLGFLILIVSFFVPDTPSEHSVQPVAPVAVQETQHSRDRELESRYERTGNADDLERHSAIQRMQFLMDLGE